MNKPRILLLTLLFNLLFSACLMASSYNLSAEVLFSLGEAYLKQHKYAQARIEFSKCLLLDPQHQQAKRLLKQLATRTDETAKGTTDTALAKNFSTPKKENTTSYREPITSNDREQSWALKQGTWHLKEGQIYSEIYTKYLWHDKEFTSKGNTKSWSDNGEYYEVRTEYKLEYGLTDKYTLLLYPVFKRAHWKDDSQDHTRTGFVEIWPGIKYLVFDEPFLCWLWARLKFPFNYREGAGVAAALGKHQIDGEIKLLTAKAFPDIPGYAKFELGFRARNEEPCNEILYFSQFGYNIVKNMVIEFTLDGLEGIAQAGGLDEDWVKFTIGPIFKLSPFNIKFGYGRTFFGKNTSAAEELYLSIYSWW